MQDNIVQNCMVYNSEKNFDNFCNKYTECKQCIIKRVIKRYCDKKEKVLQQRRDNYARFKDFDNRLKALEEELSVNNNST